MSTNEIPSTNEVPNETTDAIAAAEEVTANRRDACSTAETTIEENGRDARSTEEAANENNRRDACSTAETTTEESGRDARSTLSERKVAANRRNAQKSTGPVTMRGKEAARLNAVRHGILSSAVVVRGVRIREQEDEFKALRAQCWECLAPVGRMEEALVDKIVTAQWRMRRALIAETGEIARSVDGGLRRRGDVASRIYGTLVDPIRDSSVALEESTAGLDFLEGILRRVRDGTAKDGELTEEMCQWMENRFGGANAMTKTLREYRWKYLTGLYAMKKACEAADASQIETDTSPTADSAEVLTDKSASTTPAADKPSSAGAAADKQEMKLRHQTAVERYIELKLMHCAELRRKCLEREDKEETAEQAADVLPSSQVLEKIMRYEAALERQMYRALNQLERLQRRRGGEKLAAPLMMDVMK